MSNCPWENFQELKSSTEARKYISECSEYMMAHMQKRAKQCSYLSFEYETKTPVDLDIDVKFSQGPMHDSIFQSSHIAVECCACNSNVMSGHIDWYAVKHGPITNYISLCSSCSDIYQEQIQKSRLIINKHLSPQETVSMSGYDDIDPLMNRSRYLDSLTQNISNNPLDTKVEQHQIPIIKNNNITQYIPKTLLFQKPSILTFVLICIGVFVVLVVFIALIKPTFVMRTPKTIYDTPKRSWPTIVAISALSAAFVPIISITSAAIKKWNTETKS